MLRRLFLALIVTLFAGPAFADNRIVVTVDLNLQTMLVRVDGETRFRWDVSTGRRGYTTPTGRYQPIRMHERYFSRKYDNAPMPFSIFFVGGYAIHATSEIQRLGEIASHGCVRLAPENAEALFQLVKTVGTENTVIRIRG